jgi:pimeloyl-ACP methyl ester carboxylesterase
LHELLNEANIPRPLILLGHSAGGLYIREYARRFSKEIAGAIMVDSSSPAQADGLPGWRKDWEQDKRDLPRQIWKDKIRTWSGWNRLTGHCHSIPSKELSHLTAQYEAETCRPKYAGEEDNELPYFNDSFEQAGRLASFGNIPLVVISRDTRSKQQKDNAIWDDEQEQLKSLSPNSWPVIAAGAGHGVHHDRPEVVTSQSILLIDYLQGLATPPFGTTLVR